MTPKKMISTAKTRMSPANELTRDQIDLYFMKKAFLLAKKALLIDEVPIAAIVVDSNNHIISQAHNLRETKQTVLGHAEIIATHLACKKRKSWRLNDCTLYVTLEPCFMCAGALVQSRFQRVVFASHDPKGGALQSLAHLGSDTRLNHQFDVSSGVFANECSQLLKSFFKNKRKIKKGK